jgi:hypothetical protein
MVKLLTQGESPGEHADQRPLDPFTGFPKFLACSLHVVLE